MQVFNNLFNPQNNTKPILNNINFGAKFVCSTTIKQKSDNNYKNLPANIVEIDETDSSDNDAINDVAKIWQSDSFNNLTFVDSIVHDIEMRKVLNLRPTPIYAITLQENNFEKLDSERVLGLVEFSKVSDGNKIDYLQVNPLYVEKCVFDKKVCGIGTALINFLKGIADNFIEVTSSKSAKGFYEKMGFVRLNDENYEYIWYKDA